ncbi:hypothetical protein ACTFIR_007844 [Dictyostelium discoideum]
MGQSCVIVLEDLTHFIEYSKNYYKAERTYVKYDFIKELARGKKVDINGYIIKISEEEDTKKFSNKVFNLWSRNYKFDEISHLIESNGGKFLNIHSSSKHSVSIMNDPSIKNKKDKKAIIFTIDLKYDSIKEGTVDLTKNQVSFGILNKIFRASKISYLFRCHYIVTTKEISNSNLKLDSVQIELVTPSFITLCIKNGKIF